MSKFKKGDWVKIKDGRNIVQITEVSSDGKRFSVNGLQQFFTIYSLADNLVKVTEEEALTISLVKLREVLNGMADTDGFVVETPDNIINRIKQEL